MIDAKCVGRTKNTADVFDTAEIVENYDHAHLCHVMLCINIYDESNTVIIGRRYTPCVVGGRINWNMLCCVWSIDQMAKGSVSL